MKGWRIFAAGTALLSSPVVPAWGAPVLLISIDGLRPADVLEAKEKGLKLPNLQRFVDEGSWAKGVKGVLPTITYPSHTTLVTGVSPARHGIYGNTTFDPMQINQAGWYWYGSDIKSETLWDAAAKAGLTTANVHWPVSVGIKSITWNLPQIWRTGHEDDAKLLSALATPGLVKELEKESGPYAAGIDESIEGDENRAQFAVKLMAAHRPEFLTVYLTALDHAQHMDGPDSPAARAVLERLDAVVGKLAASAQATRPETVIAVASDHGFATIDTEVNLFRAFIDAGLIMLDVQGKVASWKAMPWPSGGSAAIVLADAKDPALSGQVAAVLSSLKSKPELKIDRILDATAIKALGGNPQASFYVAFKPGATAANFKGASVPLVSAATYRGTHGYLPDEPSMRASFMVMGPNILRGHDLGIIDMRMIAPTLASVMGARLPLAELPALDVSESP
jgi:predicted AlkP superfamily pyrophosphatase or phosphodiesterase